MSSPRTTAAVVGVLYIIGTAAGASSVAAVGGLLDGPDVLGSVAGHPDRVRIAALCILLMGIALAPIPAVLYPLLSRLDRPLAVGYVIVRGALETFTYLCTVVVFLLLAATAERAATADADVRPVFTTLGDLLLDAQDPAIVAVQDVVFGLGALILYTLLYRGRLVRRWLSAWGLVAAVAYVAGGLVAWFGGAAVYLLMLMLAQEMVMAVWLIVKGFDKDAPALREPSQLVPV